MELEKKKKKLREEAEEIAEFDEDGDIPVFLKKAKPGRIRKI